MDDLQVAKILKGLNHRIKSIEEVIQTHRKDLKYLLIVRDEVENIPENECSDCYKRKMVLQYQKYLY